MIRRTTTTGAMLCLLVAGASFAAAQQEEPQTTQSDLRQKDGDELVEITIRLPDGRVIKRKEQRIASRVESDLPILKGNRPPVVRTTSKNTSNGDVDIIKGGVSGGSNSASTSTGGGGGGGGGGGSSSTARGGGGGGGGDGTTTAPSGGHGGGTTDDIIAPVQPDTDPTVRFYAWDNVGSPFQHIQEAVLVDARSRTPEQLALRVAQQVRQQDADKVALRFWKEFEPATRDPFDLTNPRELIDSGGYDAGLSEYWNTFVRELAAQGVRPDYLIFDQEEGVGFWNIPQAQRRAFFAELLDPARPVSNELPESMRGLSVDDFMNYRSSAGRDAYNDYNQFATEFRAKLLRRIFYDAFEREYGVTIPTSNYRDLIAGFPVFYYTGRTAPVATVAGVSAPVTYLDTRGEDGVRYQNMQKDQRWNRLIDKLNAVRSSAQPGLTTPWIAPPGYGRNGPDTWARTAELEEEKALWNELMQHMLAMGVDTFILWNPGTRFNQNAIAIDDWMDDWLREHPVVSTTQLRSMPAIPLDADQIETNGYVTTYDEYLSFMGIDE